MLRALTVTLFAFSIASASVAQARFSSRQERMHWFYLQQLAAEAKELETCVAAGYGSDEGARNAIKIGLHHRARRPPRISFPIKNCDVLRQVRFRRRRAS